MANTRSRDISHELFSPTLKTFGLIKALQEQCEHIPFAHPDLELNLDADENLRFDPQLELNLFRISQELLNNTLKYAHASQVRISVRQQGGFIIFSYSDNGKGFDLTKIKKGVGLNSIDSRVQRFQGQLNFKSAPGKGFQLDIKLLAAL